MIVHKTSSDRQRGYFALSVALLVSVLSSVIILSMFGKLSRLDAESVLIDDREDYAIAVQLEHLMDRSIQRVAGQRSLIVNSATTMRGELSAGLSDLHLPPNSEVTLDDSYPEPPSLSFFPNSISGVSRVPLSGELDPADIPYGALGGLLKYGYYVPTVAQHTRTFGRTRKGEAETHIDVTSSYYSVPLTNLRFVLYNSPPDLGGTRRRTVPDLYYLDGSNRVQGIVMTAFTASDDGGEVIDPVNAVGAGSHLHSYNHRAQVCEEIFHYLFQGSYLSNLSSSSGALNVSLEDLASALEAHDGLYTEEQEAALPDETPPPPASPEFKMDLNQFGGHEVIYFSEPAASPVEITILDGAEQSSLGTPLVVVYDGSGSGSFRIRFEEVINRPVLYVLIDTTIEFSDETQGLGSISSGCLSGAFLMSSDSGFSADASSSQSSRIVYGAVLGHHTMMDSGFAGAQGHPVPVLEFPNSDFYRQLENYSPRVFLVDTTSKLVPVKTKDALVSAP